MKHIYLFLLLFCTSLPAQINVSGTAKDTDNTPLAGANIYLKGTLDGSISSENGNFRFTTSTSGKGILVCSYIGYESQEREIDLSSEKSVNIKFVLNAISIAGEEVVVRASTFNSGTGNSVTLTPLEVLTIPGAAADIFRAIQSFPGVQQVDDGAGLFVRGGDVAETAIIVDGAYLKRPYRYESPTGGFFGTISPFLVDGTVFSSGGFSSRYGNALSGVLAIDSRGIPSRRQTTLSASLAAGSVLLSLPIKEEKFGLSLSANYSNTEALFELNGHRREISNYPSAYDLNLNSTWQYSQTGSAKLFLFREGNQTGLEVADQGELTIFEGDGITELANLQVKQAIGRSWVFSSNLAASDFTRGQKLNLLDLDITESLGQFTVSMDYLSSSGLSLLSGAGTFINRIAYKGTVPIFDEDSPQSSYDIDVSYEDVDTHVFQELQGQISDKVQYTIGWRGENHTLSNTFTLDPRLSVSVPLTQQASLVFSGGRYHQLPSLDYFDADFGNASLQPQRSWHAISGVSVEKDRYLFRLEGYYKRYSQLVREGSDRAFSSNGSGYSRGIDVFIKRNHPRYSGWIAYSYLQSKREWLRAPALSPTRFDISNQLTFVGKADLSLRWHLAFSYRYTTGRPYTSSATTYLDSRVPDYHKADASINYLRSFFPGNLTVFFLAVANVFNRDNIFDYRYSADFSRREAVNSSMLRNVYFGMSFTL